MGKPLKEFLKKKKLKRTYVDAWLYPVKNKSGKIVRGVIVHQDVTKKGYKNLKILNVWNI